MSSLTPNMSLVVPTVGVDTGISWENAVNANSATLDQHNHGPGSGVPISPTGLNINSDLPFNANNATLVRTVRFSPQSASLTAPADIGCVYVAGADLFYNDENGNRIQITSGGTVNATSSGISSGTATASFVSSVLVVNSATNTPASIQGGSILLGNPGVSGSKYLTLSAPSSLAANYSLILPSIPAATSVVTLDTSGNFATSAALTVAFVPTGAYLPFAGSTAPSGFVLCDGSSYSTTTLAALFAVIGYTYGGSGSSFNVPNMSGRVAVGTGGTIGASLGGTGGEATHVLTTPEMPSHSHTDAGHAHAIAVQYSSVINSGSSNNVGGTGGSVDSSYFEPFGTNTGFASITSTGGGGAHNNVQPYLAGNFIIKT